MPSLAIRARSVAASGLSVVSTLSPWKIEWLRRIRALAEHFIVVDGAGIRLRVTTLGDFGRPLHARAKLHDELRIAPLGGQPTRESEQRYLTSNRSLISRLS